MIQQVTRGIKITVFTEFKGAFHKNRKMLFAFNYRIQIENQGKDCVQLTSRFWRIKDSLSQNEIVEGEGVIGKKPVLQPGESHTYRSGCLLNSPFGSMKGYYKMINFTSTRRFKVHIPSFKLSAPYALN